MTDNTAKIQVGARVRHNDGAVGEVVRIEGAPGQRLVEWAYCGRFRVSGESHLKVVTGTPPWRRQQ